MFKQIIETHNFRAFKLWTSEHEENSTANDFLLIISHVWGKKNLKGFRLQKINIYKLIRKEEFFIAGSFRSKTSAEAECHHHNVWNFIFTKSFVALQLELVVVSMNDNQAFWQMEYSLSVSKLSEVLTNLYYLLLLKCFLFDDKRLIFYGHHWNNYF